LNDRFECPVRLLAARVAADRNSRVVVAIHG
jgi:hypothetical protein